LGRCRHRSDRRCDARVCFHQTDFDDGHCANLLADDHRRRAGAPSDSQSPGGYAGSVAFNTATGQQAVQVDDAYIDQCMVARGYRPR
jgi:hypothetical protein